jgi:serine/threonine protein kinase
VAVKVLRIEKDISLDSSTTQEAERLFEREMKAISLLDHPHILPVFDYGTEQIGATVPTYLVMPYRPEGSLLDWLHRQDGNMSLDPAKVVHIVLQAADALQHAHERQILHQDIKPSNFLIRVRNSVADMPDVLLADFGVARFINGTSSSSQTVRGTPNYMPPEQWEGRPVPASDQYALAVMAFFLLTGQTPFKGSMGEVMRQHYSVPPPTPSLLNPRLSPGIDAVLLRALAKRPEERFPTVLQFALALQQAVQSDAWHVSPSPYVTPHHLAQWATPALSGGPLMVQSAPSRPLPQRTTEHVPSSAPQYFEAAGMLPGPSIQPAASASSLSSAQRTPPPEGPLSAASSHAQGASRSRFSRSQKLLLIAIAIFVVLAGSGIVFYSSGGWSVKTATRSGNATQAAMRLAHIRGIAAARATATEIAQISQGATAAAIANDPYLTGKGKLVLSDPLSEPANWLPQVSGSWGGTCAFNNGVYDLAEAVVTRSYGCNLQAAMQMRNFIYEVQMSFVEGNCGGLRFRYHPDQHAGYILRLCSGGTIILSTGPKYTVLLRTNSPLARRGYNRSNILAVSVIGNRLTVYINKQIVGSCIDVNNTFGIGTFAFDVQAASQPTEIALSNVKIWQL